MVKVLVIDNSDSFTYNLVEMFRQTRLCTVDVVYLQNLIIEKALAYDGIVLSPGPGLPKERPYLREVLKAIVGKVPVLGVCLGHQALIEYFGGSLRHLGEIIHGESSALVVIEGDFIFHNVGPKIKVGRYHSFTIDEKQIPNGIIITSYTPNKIVMSFKHKDCNVRGVQFHPESILTPQGFQMLSNWIERCI